MVRLAERARELALIDPEVEAGERPWRELTARERLDDLKRFITKGRFLEIGCSTGEMLAAAGLAFMAVGGGTDEENRWLPRAPRRHGFSREPRDAALPAQPF